MVPGKVPCIPPVKSADSGRRATKPRGRQKQTLLWTGDALSWGQAAVGKNLFTDS